MIIFSHEDSSKYSIFILLAKFVGVIKIRRAGKNSLRTVAERRVQSPSQIPWLSLVFVYIQSIRGGGKKVEQSTAECYQYNKSRSSTQ